MGIYGRLEFQLDLPGHRIEFLTTNTTSMYQTLDLDLIAHLKIRYWSCLPEQLVEDNLMRDTGESQFSGNPNHVFWRLKNHRLRMGMLCQFSINNGLELLRKESWNANSKLNAYETVMFVKPKVPYTEWTQVIRLNSTKIQLRYMLQILVTNICWKSLWCHLRFIVVLRRPIELQEVRNAAITEEFNVPRVESFIAELQS